MPPKLFHILLIVTYVLHRQDGAHTHTHTRPDRRWSYRRVTSSTVGGGIGFSAWENEIKSKTRFHLIIYSCHRSNVEPPGVFVCLCVSVGGGLSGDYYLREFHSFVWTGVYTTPWNGNYAQTRCSPQEEEKERQGKERVTDSRKGEGGGAPEALRDPPLKVWYGENEVCTSRLTELTTFLTCLKRLVWNFKL